MDEWINKKVHFDGLRDKWTNIIKMDEWMNKEVYFDRLIDKWTSIDGWMDESRSIFWLIDR